MRQLPNIIITGTPGVGKTTTCEQLVSLYNNSASQSSSNGPVPATGASVSLKHLSINDVVKSRGCDEGYDERLQTYIVDEDKLLDELEREMFPEKRKKGADAEDDGDEDEGEGGWVIDWHACDIFPERWIDLVVVLRCASTHVLYDRLEARNYPEEKVQENMDAEIFGVLAEEARDGFPGEGMVVELQSENVEDVDSNCERIIKWVNAWCEGRRRRERSM